MRIHQHALLLISLLPQQINSCVVPKGIEVDCPSGSTTCLPVSAFDGLQLNDPAFSVFGTAVGTILSVTPGIYGYETPVQNHLASSAMTPTYGAAAAFHDTALEFFGTLFFWYILLIAIINIDIRCLCFPFYDCTFVFYPAQDVLMCQKKDAVARQAPRTASMKIFGNSIVRLRLCTLCSGRWARCSPGKSQPEELRRSSMESLSSGTLIQTFAMTAVWTIVMTLPRLGDWPGL